MYLEILAHVHQTIFTNASSCIFLHYNVVIIASMYCQLLLSNTTAINDLIQNSQVVKKECGPQKGCGEKRFEIQGSSQEMAVVVD